MKQHRACLHGNAIPASESISSISGPRKVMRCPGCGDEWLEQRHEGGVNGG